MFKIGCHLSASKGYMHMAKEILSIGGNTFQFFTRNPIGGTAKELDLEDINNLYQTLELIYIFYPLYKHASHQGLRIRSED